jgi:hypothetical protein
MSSSTTGSNLRTTVLTALLLGFLCLGGSQPLRADEAGSERTVSDLLARARAAYGAERWNEALALYQQLLWESASDADRREATERMREIDHRLKATPSKPAEPVSPPAPGVETPPPALPPAAPPSPSPVPAPLPALPPAPVLPPRQPSGVADCLEAFRKGVEPDCTDAREFLRMRGPSVLPALREAERPGLSASVRAHLARVYGMLGDVSAADLLLRRLDDSSPDVRAEACRALGRLGVASSVPKLRPLLKDGTPRVRERAAEALGRVGDIEAVDELAGMLVDRTGQPSLVRAAAADALGFLDLAASRAALVAALRDVDARVRRAAVSGLARQTKGVDRCYDPEAEAPEREGAVRAWETWLAEQAG